MKNRRHSRFQIMATVVVTTEEFGTFDAVAVNISRGGIFIQTFDPLPLGTSVIIELGTDTPFYATGVVRSHYYMTYRATPEQSSYTGMGIVFTDFHDNEATQSLLSSVPVN
ncbi:MAG: PilZ domain-containing protein [Deltaproteobacteria bacterium]|nr:PilZ domain-containing protein [Deltaproteobacteria bacterium]